jgi:uncharacterized protein (TIGR00297 family)
MGMTGWLTSILVAAGCTAAALLCRVVDLSGAVAGFTLAVVFTRAGGLVGFTGLALLVVVGSVASRIGYRRKQALGVAQERGGRRGAVHALANAGPAALFLVLSSEGLVPAAACWGALAAALSDTLSSEVGLLSRRPPRLLLLGREMATGADGGMSWLGTLAGVITAAVVAGLMALLGDVSGWFVPVLVGGVAGNICDSVLGITLEPRLPRPHGNEIVNALASTAGGLTAWLVSSGAS